MLEKKKRGSVLILSAVFVAVGAAALAASSLFFGRVGPQGDGTGVTPNKWILTPAGLQVEVGDRPMAFAASPDGRYLAITNGGQGVQNLTLFDTYTNKVVQKIPYPEPEALMYGLVWSKDGKSVYASAGGNNKIRSYSFDGKTLTEGAAFILGDLSSPIFPVGLALSSEGKTLYAALNYGNSIMAIDTTKKNGLAARTLKFGDANFDTGKNTLPYALQLSKDDKTLYVSHTNAKAVSVISTAKLELVKQVPVGDQPSGMALAQDGKTLFVANANSDTVSLVDTASNTVRGEINLRPFDGAPYGSIPNALAVSGDDKTLYVTNGGNNDLAVVDLASGKVRGLIPTAWYPSAVMPSKNGKMLYVANLKGLGAGPNPLGPIDGVDRPDEQYIAGLGRGTISILETPDEKTLANYTAQVVKNNGFDETRQAMVRGSSSTKAQPIPRRVGDLSVFKHVIYVIKENRTYDQILGDLKQGDGDSSLALYGQDVTPNQHALALEYGLFDNFYCDAEVSADGHDWAMAASAGDYTQRFWASGYSDRNRGYDWEGATNAANPTGGFLFDFAKRAGLSYRVYGEFWDYASEVPNVKPSPAQPNLVGHWSPTYLGFEMSYSDQDRFKNWKTEFDGFVKNGDLPQLEIVALPRDHTAGSSKGLPTPKAMVADNDLAFGKIVEAVSNSPYWKDTLILSTEDDAQSGPDHVDAHRTIAFAISAYNKRGVVDHTQYSQVAMLRTLELVLGLPPMTQFDAAATPMIAAFQDTPDLKAYKALTPKQSLTEMSTLLSYKAKESSHYNFKKPDRVNNAILNEILWHSAKGAHAPMPQIHSSRRINRFASWERSRFERFMTNPYVSKSEVNVQNATKNLERTSGSSGGILNDQLR
jgi:YVTN family beta-propeller protein